MSQELVSGAIVALVLVGLIYAIGLNLSRRRAAMPPAPDARDPNTAALSKRADRELVAADDAVRDARQQLRFLQAQFTDDELAPFRAAVDSAGRDLSEAFRLRQELDEQDSDPFTRQRLYGEIIHRSASATTTLTAQEAPLATLQEHQRHAPEALDQLAAQADALAARVPAAEQTVGGFHAYAASSWASVQGNAAEASKRIAFARASLDAARTALAAQDQKAVAAGLGDTQSAIAEAGGLLDAIDNLGASIAEARDGVAAELAAASADLDSARRALAGGAATTERTQRLADATAVLAKATAEATATPPDPIAAFRDATAANAAADAVLAEISNAAAATARRQAVLEGAIRAATMAVAQANDFIDTRRAGVGSEARTRLAAAQAQLDQAKAIAPSDQDKAIVFAQRAQSIANGAYIGASLDFGQFDATGVGGIGDAVVGASVIGGLLGGMLSGGSGGRRSGGWGGGGWAGTRWGSAPDPAGGSGFAGGWGGVGRRSA